MSHNNTPLHNDALSILTEQQLLHVNGLIQRLGDPTKHVYPVDVYTTRPHGSRQIKRDPGWEDTVAEDLEEITEPYIATDENGRPLVIYMPDYLSEKAVKEVTVGLKKLHDHLGVKAPKADTRHTGLDLAELEETYGPHGYGTLHCAAWFETGHVEEGPMISSEMCTGSKRLNATCRFVQATRTVKEELSLLYAAGDPSSWRRCVDSFKKLQQYVPATVILRTSTIDPWSSIALNSNLPARIHRDLNDAERELSGLSCFGSFYLGFLALPSLGIKLRFKVRDACIVNTFFLPHYVVKWTVSTHLVSRFSMSFFNHQDVLDWVRTRYKAKHKKVKSCERMEMQG